MSRLSGIMEEMRGVNRVQALVGSSSGEGGGLRGVRGLSASHGHATLCLTFSAPQALNSAMDQQQREIDALRTLIC